MIDPLSIWKEAAEVKVRPTYIRQVANTSQNAGNARINGEYPDVSEKVSFNPCLVYFCLRVE